MNHEYVDAMLADESRTSYLHQAPLAYDSTTASLKKRTLSGSYQTHNFSTHAGHYSYFSDAAYRSFLPGICE